MPFRITDLPAYPGLLTGSELLEVSLGGNASYKITAALFKSPLAANIITVGGTYNLLFSNYGDVLVNTNNLVTVQLPAAVTRSGFSASIADIGGFAATKNITILPSGVETIMGQASLTIAVNYAGFTLWPISTGGWYTK